MNVDYIIRAVQTALGVESDGKAGPETWAAIYARLVPNEHPATATLSTVFASTVDARSEKAIATLLPEVQPYARALVNQAAAQGITIKVTSGTRTYAEQDALFAQAHDGKDNNGNGRVDEAAENVTRAKGGYSNHNFGVAFDVTIFNGSEPVWESPNYKAVGAIGRALGLEWGGDWKSFKDEPHFQLRPKWATDLSESDMLAQMRARKSAGRDLFA